MPESEGRTERTKLCAGWNRFRAALPEPYTPGGSPVTQRRKPDMTDRRTFLTRTGGCLAQLAVLDAMGWMGPGLFAADRPTRIVQEVPWGRLEEVAEGVWSLISTPLEDRRTLCNGGIVQGRDGVVMIEAFASDEGAVWMAERARALTGRWPDHVVVTHYHGDHVAGLAGARSTEGPPGAHLTAVTRDLTREQALSGDATALVEALEGVTLVPADSEVRLDLGGRVLRLVPRSGHTASDVTVELEDPSVVFCGDLVWHRYFPNFMDTRPSELTAAVRGLTRERSTTYVPGHGPLSDSADLDRFRDFLEVLESHARTSLEAGRSLEEAAETLVLPEPFAEWYQFSRGYPQRAMERWYRDLRGEGWG